MARLWEENGEGLERAAALLTAVPMTLSAWVRPADTTSSKAVCGIGNLTGSNNNFGLFLTNAGKAEAYVSQNGSFGEAITTASYSANTWHHLAGVFPANNSRSVYLDGGNKVTETTSITPAGVDRTSVGLQRQGGSGSQFYFLGRIAEVAVWSVALSDAEVAQLAAGANPRTIQASSLVEYWPITGQAVVNPAETGVHAGLELVFNDNNNIPVQADGPPGISTNGTRRSLRGRRHRRAVA